MSRSNCEELIAILWFILCLMLADRGYVVLTYITFGFGAFAVLCSIVFALRQARK